MNDWQTANAIIWYMNLYFGIWDSHIARWDDLAVPWDAIGNHDWYENDPQPWYTNN